MEFQKIQLTNISRHRNSIEVAKITSINGNNITIERFNGDTETFPINHLGDYAPDQYIDIQYFRTGSSSYTLKLIGHTPPQFYPEAETR